jgi:hypothetical protein
MSGQCSAHQRASRQLGAALAAFVAAVLVASPAAAMTRAASSPAGAANAAQWCALVIQINTKYGTMKNKRFLPFGKVPLSTWKALVNAAVAGTGQLVAAAPSEIKKAMIHEMAWFARIKANHYSKATPLGSWTVAEVGKITNFERTKCGIKV